MTIDCAKCGAYLTEAAQLNGTMRKICVGCKRENLIAGKAEDGEVSVTVEAMPLPVDSTEE